VRAAAVQRWLASARRLHCINSTDTATEDPACCTMRIAAMICFSNGYQLAVTDGIMA
jgi:hypothetical protein